MFQSQTTRLGIFILVMSFAIILAGCGGGDEESDAIPMPDIAMERPLPEPDPEPDLRAELETTRDMLMSEVQQIESDLAAARDHLAERDYQGIVARTANSWAET